MIETQTTSIGLGFLVQLAAEAQKKMQTRMKSNVFYVAQSPISILFFVFRNYLIYLVRVLSTMHKLMPVNC